MYSVIIMLSLGGASGEPCQSGKLPTYSSSSGRTVAAQSATPQCRASKGSRIVKSRKTKRLQIRGRRHTNTRGPVVRNIRKTARPKPAASDSFLKNLNERFKAEPKEASYVDQLRTQFAPEPKPNSIPKATPKPMPKSMSESFVQKLVERFNAPVKKTFVDTLYDQYGVAAAQQ